MIHSDLYHETHIQYPCKSPLVRLFPVLHLFIRLPCWHICQLFPIALFF
jgi:hypothetical protein